MLKINKLSYKYGQQEILNNISINIAKPGLYVLAGINGCGKSTLFNCIAGFLPTQQGTIEINNQSKSDGLHSQLGIVTEPFVTTPTLTVSQILNICCSIKQVDYSVCDYWLNYWELDKTLGKSFKALSVGMRKRLAIVTSLIGDPTFLLWDEPFNGLDPLGMEKLRELILELIKQGKTIFLSTHILGEIDINEATFLVLKEGEIHEVINQTSSKNEVLEILQN